MFSTSTMDKCDRAYAPLDLRGSFISQDSDSDINVESDEDDDMVHMSRTQSGK